MLQKNIARRNIFLLNIVGSWCFIWPAGAPPILSLIATEIIFETSMKLVMFSKVLPLFCFCFFVIVGGFFNSLVWSFIFTGFYKQNNIQQLKCASTENSTNTSRFLPYNKMFHCSTWSYFYYRKRKRKYICYNKLFQFQFSMSIVFCKWMFTLKSIFSIGKKIDLSVLLITSSEMYFDNSNCSL